MDDQYPITDTTIWVFTPQQADRPGYRRIEDLPAKTGPRVQVEFAIRRLPGGECTVAAECAAV